MTHGIDLPQLEAFQEVVRAGSFRRAARALFLSHPALSGRIRRLEDEVGQVLFERRKNRVGLTPAGRAFLPYARRALEIQREGREAVAAAAPALDESALRVAATPTATTYLLPAALAALRLQMEAPVEVTSARTAQVLGMVLKQEVDVGVLRVAPARAPALLHPDTEAVKLCTEPVVLVTHPAHPFAALREADLDGVALEPVLLYSGASFFSLVEQRCREMNVPPLVRMKLDGVDAAKRMVQRGLGITFAPWSAVRKEVRAGSLARVPLHGGGEPTVDAVALVKRGVPLSAAACALLNCLMDEGDALAASYP